MRKWRAMERQMAPTSQGLDQGGIFSRDWFSDRLGSTVRDFTHQHLHVVLLYFVFALLLPVQGVAHLYGNQDRQSHSHGVRRLKDWTLHTGELHVVFSALQVVRLWTTRLEKWVLPPSSQLLSSNYRQRLFCHILIPISADGMSWICNPEMI